MHLTRCVTKNTPKTGGCCSGGFCLLSGACWSAPSAGNGSWASATVCPCRVSTTLLDWGQGEGLRVKVTVKI